MLQIHSKSALCLTSVIDRNRAMVQDAVKAKKPNFSQIEKMKTSPNDGMRVTYTAHRNGSKFFNRIQDPQIAILTATIVGIVIAFSCSRNMYLTALLALIGLLLAFPKTLLMLYGKVEQHLQKSQVQPSFIARNRNWLPVRFTVDFYN